MSSYDVLCKLWKCGGGSLRDFVVNVNIEPFFISYQGGSPRADFCSGCTVSHWLAAFHKYASRRWIGDSLLFVTSTGVAGMSQATLPCRIQRTSRACGHHEVFKSPWFGRDRRSLVVDDVH